LEGILFPSRNGAFVSSSRLSSGFWVSGSSAVPNVNAGSRPPLFKGRAPRLRRAFHAFMMRRTHYISIYHIFSPSPVSRSSHAVPAMPPFSYLPVRLLHPPVHLSRDDADDGHAAASYRPVPQQRGVLSRRDSMPTVSSSTVSSPTVSPSVLDLDPSAASSSVELGTVPHSLTLQVSAGLGVQSPPIKPGA